MRDLCDYGLGPDDDEGWQPAGTQIAFQAAVQTLDSDDFGPAAWEWAVFGTQAEATAWARERSLAGLNPAYAVARPWSVRPVAILMDSPETAIAAVAAD